MQTTHPAVPRPPFLSRPALVGAATLAAVAGLVLLLASPWERRREDKLPVRFYCAAGMAKPVKELLIEFEAQTGIKTEVTYGPSGTLLASIAAAPGQADLYLAADAGNMAKAKKDGLVDEVIRLGTQYPVLVVNRATAAYLEKSGTPITRLKDLLRKDLKVVLANTAASIGQLSRDIFTHNGLWEQLKPHASTVGTVNEVATAVRASEHAVGIVWNAVAHEFDLTIVPVAELSGHSEPMLLGVLAKTSRSPAALKLARFLQASDRGGAVFAGHHFEPIKDGDPWDPRPVLHIDAGAMLKPVLDPVVRRFEAREGVKVDAHYAGCGVLVSKMKGIKGAAGGDSRHFPDAYFACDLSFLEQVSDWFDARHDIAKNDVVIAVPRGVERGVGKLDDLARDDLRVGLCDPEMSALGSLTDKILTRLDPDLKDRITDPERKHPVTFSPDAHTLVNQIRAGNLHAAVVYRSSVMTAPEWQKHFVIVELNHADAVARQPFAVARTTRHRQLLARFLDTLLSAESAAHFRNSGFRWAGTP